MPTPKKPAERRQNRVTKDVGSLPKIASNPAAPEPPAHLSEALKATWATFWSSAFAALVQPAQTPALERLWSLYDERERMTEVLRDQPMTMGSQGQLVLNPLYRQRTALDSEIRALEDRFGLNPKGGLTLGIQYGEAARSLQDLNQRFSQAGLEDEPVAEDDDPRLSLVSSS